MKVKTIMGAAKVIAQDNIADILNLFGEHFVLEQIERWLWDQAHADHEAAIAEMETYGT